jgi:putative tryptophan/tyrosine transport system substrate-binding protein
VNNPHCSLVLPAISIHTLALEAEIMEVRVADDFEQALEAARKRHVEAGILLSSLLVFDRSKQIGELALAKRLPLISLFAEFPKSGGLIAYGPNVAEIFHFGGITSRKSLTVLSQATCRYSAR